MPINLIACSQEAEAWLFPIAMGNNPARPVWLA
jgi:hypothetical protein